MSRAQSGKYQPFVQVLTAWLLIGFAAAQPQPNETVTGSWSGSIETPGTPLEVIVTFTARDALAGTIDIPAQGAEDLPLGDVTLTGARVRFTIRGVPGAPTFAGRLEGDELRGTFTQAGQEFPFELARDVTAEPTAAEPAEADTYSDPQGRFTVPVPTNWAVREGDGFVTLSDPGGEILAHLLVTPDGNPEQAIARAWRRVDPEFAPEPSDVQRPPPEPGVEATVVTN